MIPLDDMNKTLEQVNKWLAISADASRKANEEMKAMFARAGIRGAEEAGKGKNKPVRECLTVVEGGKK